MGEQRAKGVKIREDQNKYPTGKHRRDQSMYPSSFSKSKSFGGVANGGSKKKSKKKKSKSLAERLDAAFSNLSEDTEDNAISEAADLIISADGAKLDAQGGILYVDGEPVEGLDNHADILMNLVAWFANSSNSSERISLDLAISGLADMARSGVGFE